MIAELARAAVLVTASAAFFSCTAPHIYKVPDKLDRSGLLVAYVHSDEYPDAALGAPVVDEQIHFGAQNGGYIVLALRPGDHVLNAIYRHKNTVTIPTEVGNTYVTDSSAFEVKRKFRIEAGRVTNLGMIVVRAPPKAGGKPNVLFLDNTRDMRDILASAHRSPYASTASADFLTSGSFADDSTVQELRLRAAARKLSSRKWQLEHADASYITAAYGTIARIRRNGSANTLQLIPTETLRDLTPCSVSLVQVACVIADSQLLFVAGDKATLRAAPAGVHANSVHIARDREVVLVDHAMNFYVSADQGLTWGKASGTPLTKPIAAGLYLPDNKNAFGMAAGRKRDYFYSRTADAQGTSLISRSAGGQLDRITLPPETREVQFVKETHSGLMVVSGRSGILWYQQQGQTEWEKRQLPRTGCGDMVFGDPAGSHIELACDEDTFWTSKDGGRSWDRIFKPQSLFVDL
jgi:photosystem II stability/assembly factor-like uncharacterized protein